jgi:hypothetical protein
VRRHSRVLAIVGVPPQSVDEGDIVSSDQSTSNLPENDGMPRSARPAPGRPEITRRNFIYGSAAAATAVTFLQRRASSGARPLPVGLTASDRQADAPVDEPPYLWGQNDTTGSGSVTVTSSTGTGTNPGDAIVVCVSTNGYSQYNDNSVTVSDGTKNTYQSVFTSSYPGVPSNGDLAGWIFVAAGSSVTPLASSSAVTVTFGGGTNTGAHTAIVIGVPSVTGIDASGSNTGSSATPSLTISDLASGVTTATMVAMEVNSNSSGAISWTPPFGPVPVDGGGTITMAALSPGGDYIVLGGDVEGYFLSNNIGQQFGTQWGIINSGLTGKYWRECACISWSQLETTDRGAGVIYACCGDDLYQEGGFLVSADNGNTWTLRSGSGNAPPQFAGNHASFAQNGYPRATGYLLIQDTTNNIIYAGAYSGGVYSSTATSTQPYGTSWTSVGTVSGESLPSGCIVTSLAVDPENTAVLYAAVYNPSASSGEVWVTTNSPTNGTSTTWAMISTTNSAGTTVQAAQELIVIGGILYAACGTNGLYQYVPPASGGPAGGTWNSLNDGTFIAAGQAGNNSSWGDVYWAAINGYAASSTEHVLILFCDNAVEVSGQCRSLVQVTVSNPGTSNQSFTPADLVVGKTVNVSSYPTPSGNQEWWHAGSNYQNWLGGTSYINAHILINPADTSNIYLTGASGFYFTTDSGGTWQLAINGLAIFAGRSVAVDPANENHVVFGDSDWTSWDLTQGSGSDQTFFNVPGPTPSSQVGGYPPSQGFTANLEGYALAFDPIPQSGVDNVFMATAVKYTTTLGNILSRASGDTTWTTNTGLYTAANGANTAPLGVAVARDNSAPSNQYVLAAVQDSTGADNGIWLMSNGGEWSQISATKGSSGIGYKSQSTSYIPFAVPTVAINPSSAPNCAYVLDRQTGQVWRGAPSGSALFQTWTMIWDTGFSFTDGTSGFLALNPEPTGTGDELWVSTPNGPYKITEANQTTTGAPTVVSLPGGLAAGGVGFASDGTLYCLGLDSPNTILFSLPNGGQAWSQVGGPGVAANASFPNQIAVSASGIVYISNTANVVAWGYPSAGWTELGLQHPGDDQYAAVATQVVTSDGSVAASGSITSGSWLMLMAGLGT